MLNIEKYKDEIIEEYQNLMKTTAIDGDGNRMNKAIRTIAYKHCGKILIGASNPFKWLCEEYKEPILDDDEKEYLSNVIKPFRNRVRCICKYGTDFMSTECILITFIDGFNFIFPSFKKGTMYKGIELIRKYTLEELGL